MRNDKGQFAEGCEGRKVGTPNKATTEIKEAFQMLLGGQPRRPAERHFKFRTKRESKIYARACIFYYTKNEISRFEGGQNGNNSNRF